MKKDGRDESSNAEEPKGNALLNVGKYIFLIAVLVAAWFVLEWLMGKK